MKKLLYVNLTAIVLDKNNQPQQVSITSSDACTYGVLEASTNPTDSSLPIIALMGLRGALDGELVVDATLVTSFKNQLRFCIDYAGFTNEITYELSEIEQRFTQRGLNLTDYTTINKRFIDAWRGLIEAVDQQTKISSVNLVCKRNQKTLVKCVEWDALAIDLKTSVSSLTLGLSKDVFDFTNTDLVLLNFKNYETIFCHLQTKS